MSDKTLFLIQSPYIKEYGAMKKAAGTYFPLGLGYISSHVKKFGFTVRFFDPNVQNISPEQIAQEVKRTKPLLVGISLMTPQFPTAKNICDVIKKSVPDANIILGGVHPSVLPRKTLEDIPSADFVCMGEGEETTLELLDTLSKKKQSFDQIKGIAWRQDNHIVLNKLRPLIANLDELSFPDRTLIDQSLYRPQSFLSFSNKSGTIYTSRGCPGKCVFCCSGHSLRARVRERSIRNIMAEIDLLRDEYGIEYLLIKDDSFPIKKRRVIEFCDALKTRHPGLKWHCMGRVDRADYQTLSRMKKAGLNDILLGIESGDDKILRKTGKKITTEQAKNTVEICDRLNIRTYGSFIFGLPGDTKRTIEKTIEFACSLPLTIASFNIMTPYPGTRAFDDFYDQSFISDEYGNFFASTGIHYVEGYGGLGAGLKMSDLPDLIAHAQKRFYGRPSQIIRMLGHSSYITVVGYLRGFLSLVIKEISRKKR